MLTIKEAAALLRCTERHLHDLVHRDPSDPEKLQAYRIGRRLVLKEDELEAYVQKRRV